MSGNLGTNNTGTSASVTSPFGRSITTSDGSFSFATPQLATSSSPFGGFTSTLGGSATSRTVSGAAPAAGASGSNVFASTVPSARSPFGVTTPIFDQPKTATIFGATLADANPPPVTTGTDSLLSDITAMPAYKGTFVEELRVQGYQQDRKTAGATHQTLSGALPMPTSLFGTPTTAQSTTGSIFGSGINSASGIFARDFVFPNPPAAGVGTSASGSPSAFERPSSMSVPGKLERIEELLRKSLLGEELVNTQFHLFSAKSSATGRVMKPHVLCANNNLLAKGSKYFLDLLSSDIKPSDSSLIDLMGDNDIPSNARIDEYGYESDSDLDDCDDPIPVANPQAPKAASPTSSSKGSAEAQPKDGNELSEDGFESVGSDTFVMKPEQPSTDEPFFGDKGKARSVARSEERPKNQTAMRLRSLESRHVLVKDTAFQTWYNLLNYLYTGKFSFLPLNSTTPGGKRGSSTSSLDGPRCSAKSMYRLACKVGLDHLRYVALAHIRGNLSEHNILKEISSRLVSKHPEILEMELDLLYSYIASPRVVANFAALAQRIAQGELPHGADIIVGIHTRFLKQRHPFSLKSAPPASLPSSSAPLASVKPGVSTSNAPEAGVKDKSGSSHVDKQGTQSGSLPSASRDSAPGVLPPASVNMTVRTTTSTKELDVRGKRKATEKHE